jgi:hypothetical protein
MQSPSKSGGLREYAVLAGILLATFAVYALSPVTTSTDSAWTFHIASSILRQRNVDLDEYRPIINLQLDYRMRVIGGHIYSYYPVATPLLVTPIVWLTNEIYPLTHRTDFYAYLAEHAPDAHTANLEKLIASGIVALSAALVYLIARFQLQVTGSLAVTLIFAFSTSMWSTASRALWQHGPSVLFLSLGLYLTLLAVDRPSLVFWVGLILGYAYLIRPTNSLSVALFGLYFLVNHRRRFGMYVLGVSSVLIPYIMHNWATYQNVFPPYSYQLFERMASPGVFGEALLGTLVSPGRGLFVFTPIFLFCIYGAYLAARQRRLSLHTLDPYLIAIVISHWIITSLFEDWGGAWSIGPRYFVDVIPFLTYLLVPVVRLWTLTGPTLKTTFLVAALFGALVQFHCSTSIDPFMWNGKPKALVEAPERKWDWGDLQFLRGLCRQNPLEGRAPACWFESGG